MESRISLQGRFTTRGVTIILIDTREQSGAYAAKFFTKHGIESELVTLSTDTGSDYFIASKFDSTAIQRKVVCSELISELDITMNETIPHLKNFTHNPIFLVEENYQITEEGYLMDRNTSRESQLLATSYFGYLETIRKLGVEVVMTRDYNESLWYMLSLHNYMEKQHYPHHTKGFKPNESAIGMLSCISKVGEKRAEKALMKQSIMEMCQAGHVDGFTEKMNEKWREVVYWKGERK